MAGNKTTPNGVDPVSVIEAVEHDTRRADSHELLELMSRATGFVPKMWGPSIIGFGRYHYIYDSGREGDSMICGFSPRKSSMVVYLLPGYDDLAEPLSRLGKHKIGKSCLYINKLADVDLEVLEEMVVDCVAKMQDKYETFPD